MSPASDEISTQLKRLNVEPVFHAIHAGTEYPLLTDYFVQRIPTKGNGAVPAEYVDGRHLIPLFASADWYAIYCVDVHSQEIFEIDVESPWPPTKRFSCWRDFVTDLYQIVSHEKEETAQLELRQLLQIDQ